VALKSKSSTVSSLDNEISKQDTPQRHAGDEWHADIDDGSQFVRSGMNSSATASLEGSTSESSSTPLQECISRQPSFSDRSQFASSITRKSATKSGKIETLHGSHRLQQQSGSSQFDVCRSNGPTSLNVGGLTTGSVEGGTLRQCRTSLWVNDNRQSDFTGCSHSTPLVRKQATTSVDGETPSPGPASSRDTFVRSSRQFDVSGRAWSTPLNTRNPMASSVEDVQPRQNDVILTDAVGFRRENSNGCNRPMPVRNNFTNRQTG
jgi:hypothetical protein